ncbi:MAG: alanine dehydrogenase [Bacteroidota bacterium]|nr:alanine dehydrogenase [Bacteroidota bacterium]
MSNSQKTPRFNFGKSGLLPQEEMLEIGIRRKKLVIGLPKEDSHLENRVGLTPEAVELLVNNGHEVIIESGAGWSSNYSDNDYSECGGYIIKDRKEILQCDIILKIAPLTINEIELLKGNQIILSALSIKSQSEQYIRMLMQKKVIALAHENLKDKDNNYPVIRSMSEIAGTTSVLIASEYLSNTRNGKGVLLGGITGITPTEVVILGAGNAAEYAAKAALGLGATIKIFDNSITKLKRLQRNLSTPIYTSVFHPQVLKKDLKSADVLIAAIHNNDSYQVYITEDMVRDMKNGAVIVDMSIDQGECIETSKITNHKNPVFTKFGVIHYCVPNIASRVARTASIALSNVFTPVLLDIAQAGGLKQQLKEDRGLRNGVYIYNGILTNNKIGNMFGIPSRDIDLLMAAF